MKNILLFVSFFCCQFSLASNTDTLIKGHSLIGKTVITPDFTLVVGGIHDSYSLSPTYKAVDATLITLDNRTSTSAFPTKGLYTKDILPPNSKLKVKKVYRSKPSLIRSIFAGDTFFAFTSDKNGKDYTVPVHQDEVFFELNGCKSKRCKNWRYPLKSILHLGKKEFNIHITYFLLDKEGMVIFKNIRPPYPEGMLNRSRKNLVSFLKNKKISIIEINKHHPFVSIKVSPLQYGDLFLNFENLKIKSVSLLNN